MSGWPEGWYREGGSERVGSPGPGGGYSGRGYSGGPTGGYRGSRRAGGWPDQPSPARPPSPPYRGGGGSRYRRPRTGRRIGKIIATIIVIILIVAVGGYFYMNHRLTRVPAIADYSGRPAQGPGQNWLITGDSGSGLTPKQAVQLHVTNNPDKGPPDTWMILHMGSDGPVLISLPRDSYVTIPGFGQSKLNASYSDGGPKLAVQTVETVTGVHIDHYAEIGYQNLVNEVNDVGGVNMCIKQPIHDSYSGVNLNAGCQTLNGNQALDYTRDRHSFATGDLQREQDQRALLKALLDKMTSPTTLLNPFRMVPAALGSSGSITVDQGAQLYQLIEVAFGLKGPKTGTVPVANTALQTSDGEAVQWDQGQASQLFNDIQNDQPIPANLLSGTNGA